MTFQEILQAKMDARQWKPPHLSAHLITAGTYTTPQSIDHWLRGAAMPRAETLRGLAKVFQCSIEELLGGEL